MDSTNGRKDPALSVNVFTAPGRVWSADAVLYLTDASTVIGDTLYVDGGSHMGRW